MKTIWNVLNGNKTIICTVVLFILSKNVLPISGPLNEILQYIFGVLGGGSLIHHVAKGSLSPDKDL